MNKQQRFLLAGVYTFLVLLFGTLLAQVQTQQIARDAVRYLPAGGNYVQVGYPPKALHYIRRGSGPTVVLIHGDGGSTYDWTMSNFDSLTRRYDVIAIDRPGFGFSETLPHQSIPSQVQYIHRGLQQMGVRRPVLVGHSRGGEVATLYAEEYPDDIAGVVTLGGACFNNADHEQSWQYKLLRMPVVGSWLAYTVYVLLGREPTKAGLHQAFLPEGTAPEHYADTYATLLLRPQTLLNWAIDHDMAVLDSLIIPRYKTIRVPFVVVNGQSDQNVPIAMARRYSQQIPGAQLIEIPNAGHELMFSHPAVVERAIVRVLQSNAGKLVLRNKTTNSFSTR